MKITLISVPFSGHFKIMKKLALSLAQIQQFEITFIVTGWENIKISNEDETSLQAVNIDLQQLSDGPILGPAPMVFTFPRVEKLTVSVVNTCKGQDYIIYDFFSPEGYIAGEYLNIPSICSIPAIMGPFEPNNALFKQGVTENTAILKRIESSYNVKLFNKLEMISDGFLIRSNFQNILWSWPDLITVNDFNKNRNAGDFVFMRSESSDVLEQTEFLKSLNQVKASGKKIIYVSFGTVVTGNLWNNIPSVHDFVKFLFTSLLEHYSDDPRYCVVVSSGRPVKDIFIKIPDNFYIFEHLPQVDVLKISDVFITHGGGNSVNEAFDAKTPMIVIPFFGDQHVCALNIDNLGVGKAFLHEEEDRELAINTESNLFFRNSLSKSTALINAVEEVLGNEKYIQKIERLRETKPWTVRRFVNLLEHSQMVNWEEGDLLYGCNPDRLHFAELTARTGFFKIGDMRPFSELFKEQPNPQSLPRIVDQYHDVLTNNNHYEQEQQCPSGNRA